MIEAKYNIPFSPIDPEIIEIIEDYIALGKQGKVHFFDENGKVNLSEGTATSIVKNTYGVFLTISDNKAVRIDRIITLMGRPGAAYDEYDRYANACLACEDLGQFGH
ncbi:hypothetical protein [Reichenbachiella sp. MALMAid0571]|uniref:hypothetical protein n=1 Tax=Reichenbachiella sp. MALMAid0571 TaxID=3143939 RepID=UPI0032DF1628